MTQGVQEQVGILPAIEPESHFGAIGLQMLGADFMPRSEDAALQERESRFDGVGMNIALHIDMELVTDGFVPPIFSEMLRCAPVGVEVIRKQNFDILANILADEFFERAAFHVRRMKEAQIAAALPNADYVFFVVPSRRFPAPAIHAADVRFIHLNLAIEHGPLAFHHRCADSVAEIPCGFVTHAERALNLTGRHSFLGLAEQERSEKPLCKWQMGVIENRASGNSELIVAILAVEQLLFGFQFDSGHLAARALRASGPAQPRQQFAALLVCRKERVYVN